MSKISRDKKKKALAGQAKMQGVPNTQVENQNQGHNAKKEALGPNIER